MKAIILISSIFYLLGIFIGNKIDLLKKSIPVEKIIIHKIKEYKPSKCVAYNEEIIQKAEADTLKSGISYSDALLKNKEL